MRKPRQILVQYNNIIYTIAPEIIKELIENGTAKKLEPKPGCCGGKRNEIR